MAANFYKFCALQTKIFRYKTIKKDPTKNNEKFINNFLFSLDPKSLNPLA